MPVATLTDDQWREIRIASEAGVEDKELAEAWGVEKNAIHQRRWREKWLTPRAVAMQRAEQEARAKAANGAKAIRAVSEGGKIGQNALEIVAEKVRNYAESGTLRIAKLAHESLQSVESLQIRTWNDASTAYGTLRKAAGMDKESQIQINVGSWGAASIREVGEDMFDS